MVADSKSERLALLAQKYEVASFVDEDPSQFLRWYGNCRDVEVASFIAAMLAFGNRKQFIPKIKCILEAADKKGGICSWIENGYFEDDFCSPEGDEKKFYRFYSYADMKSFFRCFREILKGGRFFGEQLRCVYENILEEAQKTGGQAMIPAQAIGQAFGKIFEDADIVPKGKTCANKRIHMFLRWMVRKNSSVDLGIWDWYRRCDLIIPLDTHVLQEAEKLGIIKPGSAGNLKTALQITDYMKKIWPSDPCKGDFALFGLGVDDEKTND